jgi:hypothetical protein
MWSGDLLDRRLVAAGAEFPVRVLKPRLFDDSRAEKDLTGPEDQVRVEQQIGVLGLVSERKKQCP